MEVTRRSAIGLMGASAAGLVLFGPRADDDVPTDRLVLNYWEKWTGFEGVAMRELVDEFNRTQDRLFVRYLAVNSINHKAMISIAGGAPPDVIGLWSFNLPAYAEAGALLPMDDLAASAGLTPDRWIDSVRPLLRHEGRQWAMMTTCGSLALYLNLDVLESAGVDPAFEPRTIKELDDLNDRVTLRSSRGSIQRMGFVHTEPGWWSWMWGFQFGGRLLNESGDPTATDAGNADAYGWVRSYPDRFGAEKLLSFQSGNGFYGTAQNAFLQGRVASVVQGPWLANLIEVYAPNLRYRVVPVPVAEAVYDPDAPVGLFDGDVVVIPRGAAHPEASFEFIAWLQNRARLERLALAHRKNTPLRQASAGFFERHPNRSIRVHRRLASSPRAFGVPRTRVWPRYEAEFDTSFESLWIGRLSADDMLARVQTAIEQETEFARARRGARADV